jgi:multisubunit Na+/H+ antiporter MnhB subunit
MSAALTTSILGASAPSSAPDAGLFAAVIVAAGVTALVAVGMTFFTMHRTTRLTVRRVLAAAVLGLAVVGVAVGGVLAVSPSPAQAAPDQAAPYVVTSSDDGLNVQLPTLAD